VIAVAVLHLSVQTPIDNLSAVFIGARISQTLIHITSTSVVAVLLRFIFFLIQITILGLWCIQIISPRLAPLLTA
jgi:hypothetical protein